MLTSEKIIYLQIPKTATTQITKALCLYDQSSELRIRHDFLDKKPIDKLVFASIRSPWSWYVSYWSFCCMKRGVTFQKTTRYPKLNRYLSKVVGVSPDRIPLYKDRIQRAQEWRPLYADWRQPELFREWLTKLLFEDHGRNLEKGFGTDAVSKVVGVPTYLLLRYSAERDVWKVKRQDLKNYHDILDFYEKNSTIDRFIKVEHLESDLASVLSSLGYITDVKDLKRLGKSNKSQHYTDRYYYDQFTLDLVRQRDKLIIDRFGYEPPQLET